MSTLANDSASLLEATHWYLQLGKLDRASKALATARQQGASGDSFWTLQIAVKRMQGELDAARELAREWCREMPESALAEQTLAAITGRATRARPDDSHGMAMPFVLFENFLPEGQVEVLQNYTLGQLDEMQEAGTFHKGSVSIVDKSKRRAHVSLRPVELFEWFLPLVEARLSDALPALELRPFPLGRRELQITASFDGGFYQAHRDFDRERKDEVSLRRVTYVYYFGLPGGAFSEGHLRLYDMSRSLSNWRNDRFTALVPKHNRLVLFNSEAMHEVMPVKAPGGRREDGRFTINGWFNVAPEAGDEDLRLDL